MRIAAPVKSILPFALAAALIAVPSARIANAQVTLAGEPAPAAKMAGIYRVTLSGSSLATQRLHLLVQLGERGYTCVFLSGEKEMPVDDVKLEGDVIRGRTPTSMGRGEVVLKVTEDGVSGTLTVGRTTLQIAGERIS